jgi:hypothetical protein
LARSAQAKTRRGNRDVARAAREREAARPARPVLRFDRALPADEPKPAAGLPSLAAGIGKGLGTGYGPKVVARPAFATGDVATALDTAIDYNPDASFAAWVFKLLGLREWEIIAVGENGKPDKKLQADVEAFAARVMLPYGGGVEAMLLVGMDSVLRRGAAAIELDVADGLDDVVDVDFVDPIHVDFEPLIQGAHKSMRPVYLPSMGDPVPFNPAQFRYIGLMPRPGQPHGVSPFLPLVDTAYPAAAFRDSLSRVAKNQGWSRLAFTYEYDRVVRSAPPDVVRVTGDQVEVLDWDRLKTHVESFRSALETDAEDMLEDDTWVLPDIVKAGSVGASHGSESFDFSKLAQQFDTDVIASVKGQPAVHGRQWGSDLSSTGSIQWIIQALGIEAMREIPRRSAEFALNQWLRITGRRGSVVLKLGEIRKEDRTAEVTAAKVEVETAVILRDAGWIDDGEAAMMTVGHAPTGTPRAALPAPVPAGRAADQPPLPGLTDKHATGCQCIACDGQPDGDRLVPFVPGETAGHAANEIEMDQDPPPSEDDADRVARAFDRWAEEAAPTFVGLLTAVVVSSKPTETANSAGRAVATRDDPMPEGRWQFDLNTARYRYPPTTPGKLGRMLPPDRADTLFERRLEAHQRDAARATDKMLAGKSTLREWQDDLKRIHRDTQLEARMIAVGGKGNMGFADYGAAGGRISAENRAIGRLGQEIEAGNISEPQIRVAVARRFEAGPRETYRRGRETVHARAGYALESNILEPGAEHCQGDTSCTGETERGRVPLGSIVPIGSRACKSGCKCRLAFHYSEDRELPPMRLGGG